MLAFVIDDEVYTLPMVNAEIKNGMALINGLAGEELEGRISNSLNVSLSE